MNEMTNQETDTALILENELKRRVREVAGEMIRTVVKDVMQQEFQKQKENMLLEISMGVGKMLRVIEEEGRKPLWEATPEEFGLTKEQLNSHMIEKELPDALRKQT
jgi:hypothetical protein